MKFTRTLLFTFSCLCIYSQEKTGFNLHKQFYIYGDATVIGNNILSKHKTKSFDNYFMVNDEVKMKYVDIDSDSETFSSSAAELKLPKETRKVVSATLYWSAIYSFKNGVKKRKGNRIIYKGNDKRDATIQQIKFKTPNTAYKNIDGTILLDKFNISKLTDNAPYVCYADVTALVQKNKNKNGTYTVANIKATEGYTTGGSAGGWLLYIVYETTTKIPKYISAYHGLVTVHKKPLDIEFNNFKTVSSGKTKATLTLSALEGDRSLSKDICLVYNKTKESFIPLKTKLRSERNFFNSAITKNNKHIKNRIPNSVNTLGFDIVEMTLPNENNELIANGTETIKLRLETKSDTFHLFFAAFKTELDETFYKQQQQNITYKPKQIRNNHSIRQGLIKIKNEFSNVTYKASEVKYIDNNYKKDKDNIVVEIEEQEEDKEAEPAPVTLPKIKEISKATDKTKEIRINKNIFIANLEPGYYVISNVFSKQNSLKNWTTFLDKKAITTITYIHPKNNWYYVSVYNNINKNKAKAYLKKLRKTGYFKGLWIQEINL